MHITEHSWKDKYTHIFRTDGRVVRATLRHLVFEQGQVYVHAEFWDKGRRKTKEVSPITIAALQVFWVNVDVVSDVDVVDDLSAFVPPPDCDRLPNLQVSVVPALDTSHLRCLLLSVNTFLALSATIPTFEPLLLLRSQKPRHTPGLRKASSSRYRQRSTREKNLATPLEKRHGTEQRNAGD